MYNKEKKYKRTLLTSCCSIFMCNYEKIQACCLFLFLNAKMKTTALIDKIPIRNMWWHDPIAVQEGYEDKMMNAVQKTLTLKGATPVSNFRMANATKVPFSVIAWSVQTEVQQAQTERPIVLNKDLLI